MSLNEKDKEKFKTLAKFKLPPAALSVQNLASSNSKSDHEDIQSINRQRSKSFLEPVSQDNACWRCYDSNSSKSGTSTETSFGQILSSNSPSSCSSQESDEISDTSEENQTIIEDDAYKANKQLLFQKAQLEYDNFKLPPAATDRLLKPGFYAKANSCQKAQNLEKSNISVFVQNVPQFASAHSKKFLVDQTGLCKSKIKAHPESILQFLKLNTKDYSEGQKCPDLMSDFKL